MLWNLSREDEKWEFCFKDKNFWKKNTPPLRDTCGIADTEKQNFTLWICDSQDRILQEIQNRDSNKL